jgi:hypothetical protein
MTNETDWEYAGHPAICGQPLNSDQLDLAQEQLRFSHELCGSCLLCKWWRVEDLPAFSEPGVCDGLIPEIANRMTASGSCRASSPVLIPNSDSNFHDHTPHWPETQFFDRCGEFLDIGAI